MDTKGKKPAGKFEMRRAMPATARIVDELREQRGEAHVNDMMRRAMRGEQGCFCAVELERCCVGAPMGDELMDGLLSRFGGVAVKIIEGQNHGSV